MRRKIKSISESRRGFFERLRAKSRRFLDWAAGEDLIQAARKAVEAKRERAELSKFEKEVSTISIMNFSHVPREQLFYFVEDALRGFDRIIEARYSENDVYPMKHKVRMNFEKALLTDPRSKENATQFKKSMEQVLELEWFDSKYGYKLLMEQKAEERRRQDE